MRLVFVTQTVDADHPVLAQTVDLVRALAARCESVTVLCDSVRRHDLPGNVRFRTFGASNRLGRGLRFARAAAASLLPRRTRPDAVARAHGSALRAAGGAAHEGASRSGPPLVHALERRTVAAARDAARGRRPQRQQRLVPARDLEAARDRPRDRRRPLHAVGGCSGRRAAPAPGPGQDGALEGLRHDAPGARARDRAGARRAARAPRPAADRRTRRRTGASWRRSSPRRTSCATGSGSSLRSRGTRSRQGCEPPMRSSARPSRARARRSTRSCTRPPRAVCR